MGTIYGNILAQRNTNTTYGVATQSANGLLSAADKKKLDGIAASANNYSHPTGAGNNHIPAGGSSGQILRWSSAGVAVWGNDNNTTYGNMTAATASAAGKAGLVPAPAAGKQASFLRGDGTWVVPTNTTYAVATASANGLLSAADKSKLNMIITDSNLGNFGMGTNIFASNTSGTNNIAIGANALKSQTTSGGNIAIGNDTLKLNTVGGLNVAIGSLALANLNITSGSGENVAIGQASMYNATSAHHNMAIGAYTINKISTGYDNTAIGASAMYNSTSAYRNTAIGRESLLANTTGFDNVTIGYKALPNNTTGSRNVVVGNRAGERLTTGTKNTLIGNLIATRSADADYTNSICIGCSSQVTASNQVTLGNGSITQLRCQVSTISSLSDRRVKEDIEPADINICLADVLRLPVTRYKYKDFTGTHLDTHVTGWMADDYEKVFPKGVQMNDEWFPVLDEDGNEIFETIVETNTIIDPKSGEKLEIQENYQQSKMFKIENVKNITPAEALPTLWGAVQALAKENEELKQKVAKMDEIEARLALLEVKLVGG